MAIPDFIFKYSFYSGDIWNDGNNQIIVEIVFVIPTSSLSLHCVAAMWFEFYNPLSNFRGEPWLF